MKALAFILLITLTLSIKLSRIEQKPKEEIKKIKQEEEEEILEMGNPMKGHNRPRRGNSGPGGFSGQRKIGHGGISEQREIRNGRFNGEARGERMAGGFSGIRRMLSLSGELSESGRREKNFGEMSEGPGRHFERRKKPHMKGRREGEEENERPPHGHKYL